MIKFFSKTLATCFGIGYFPLAPGTVASFGVVLLYKYFLFRLSWPFFALICIAVFGIGVIVSSIYASQSKKKDPRVVVVDEVGAQLLTLFNLSPTWPLVLAGFFLFRLFDIVKPFPIRKVEMFPKGWGIMMDDILAAAYAGILLNAYLLLR